MADREEAARAFAAAMGWRYVEDGFGPRNLSGFIVHAMDWIALPLADDSLSSHMEFLGRVAESRILAITDVSRLIQQDWCIGVLNRCKITGDIALQAMLSATAAKACK